MESMLCGEEYIKINIATDENEIRSKTPFTWVIDTECYIIDSTNIVFLFE